MMVILPINLGNTPNKARNIILPILSNNLLPYLLALLLINLKNQPLLLTNVILQPLPILIFDLNLRTGNIKVIENLLLTFLEGGD